MMTDNSCCNGLVPQDMLEILMNGVFAFAMTLIVKNNIPFPTNAISNNILQLFQYFLSIFFDGISFIFTFILLSFFYILAFEIMRHVKKVDRFFVYFIFSFLLSIVFLPLTSLLWSISDDPVPYGILFHTNVLFCGGFLFLVWQHASRRTDILTLDTTTPFIQNLSIRLSVFPITAIFGFIIDSQEISFGSIPIIILYMVPIALCIWLPIES